MVNARSLAVALAVAWLLAAASGAAGLFLIATARVPLAGLLLVWDGIALAAGVPLVGRKTKEG